MKLIVEDLKNEFKVGAPQITITLMDEYIDGERAFYVRDKGLTAVELWKVLQSVAMEVYADMNEVEASEADEWFEDEDE